MRIDLYLEDALTMPPDAEPNVMHSGDSLIRVKQYRWRIWESSDVIGASTEGYKDRRDMIHNLLAVTGGRLRRRRDELFLERRSMQRGRIVRYPVKDLTGDDAP